MGEWQWMGLWYWCVYCSEGSAASTWPAPVTQPWPGRAFTQPGIFTLQRFTMGE